MKNYCLATCVSFQIFFQTDLEEARIKERQLARDRNEKIRLYIKRFFVNLFVFILLVLALVAVYFAALFSLNNNTRYDETNFFLDLIVTYLTSIVITVVNFIAPFIFEFVVTFEDYSPEFTIRFTLVR